MPIALRSSSTITILILTFEIQHIHQKIDRQELNTLTKEQTADMADNHSALQRIEARHYSYYISPNEEEIDARFSHYEEDFHLYNTNTNTARSPKCLTARTPRTRKSASKKKRRWNRRPDEELDALTEFVQDAWVARE